VSLVVLLILGIVWAVFLVPQVVRWRAEQTSTDSVGVFRDQISVLRRTTPGAPYAASGPIMRPPYTSKAMARRRRRDILAGLCAAMGATLVVGLLTGSGAMLKAHVALDILCAAYVVMLGRARAIAAEREMKVRYLPGSAADLAAYYGTPEPELLLRRSGS
jgi:hypothetical protein